MSAIDYATARIDRAAAAAAPSRPGLAAALWRWPAASLTAAAFAVLWLPLTLIAVAAEWRGSWATPGDHGPIFGDFVQYGSAISGPLPPQIVLVALAVTAALPCRFSRLATGAIGVMGVLIAFNGVMSTFSEAEYAPQAVQSVAGLGFVAFGVAMVLFAVRGLRSREVCGNA